MTDGSFRVTKDTIGPFLKQESNPKTSVLNKYMDMALRDTADYVLFQSTKFLNKQKKVFTGTLQQSGYVKEFKKGRISGYEVGFRAVHAAPVEHGRRPGKYPPLDAIQIWVERKGIDSKAVWPIMIKIKTKGIKPAPYFRPALVGIDRFFLKQFIQYMNKVDEVNT